MKQINQQELEELKSRYREGKDKLTELEKAERENEIWEGLRHLEGPGLSKRGFERRDWFHKEFGEGPGVYEARASLLNAGAAASPLWQRILSNTLTLNTAYHVLRRARKIAGNNPLAPAVISVLKVEDGVIASPTNREQEISFEEAAQDSHKFNRRVRSLAEAYLKLRLEGIDEYLAHEVQEEFLWAIDDALNTLGAKINKLRSEGKKTKLASIQKSRFENACLKLGINCRWKRGLDPTLVRKRAKSRKFELHPDRNNSIDAANEFQAVREAETLLLEYAKLYPPEPEKNGKSKKKDESQAGKKGA